MLESFEQDGTLGRYSFLGFDPESKITVKDGVVRRDTEELDADPFDFLKSFCLSSKQEGFRGGLVGYLGHEAVRYVEPVHVKSSPYPDMEFGLYLDGVVFDHLHHTARYVHYGKSRLDELNKLLREEPAEEKFSAKTFEPYFGKTAFENAVTQVRERIAAGDAYQVVLSRKFPVRTCGSRLEFYRRLRTTNPSPYQYFLKSGKREIIGSSPEMLVRVEDRKATTFPIAGTRPRGATSKEDERLAQDLLSDPKENAEHGMLVDLARNDIGRVSRPGTVRVESFSKIKKFSHVQHLVSEVQGELFGHSVDALKSVFPAGTVSGAPKVSALRILEQLEPQERGPYGGAVGFLSLDGSCDFAISIRTLFTDGENGFIQAGAGIVKDSVPENEFYETEQKAQALLECLK